LWVLHVTRHECEEVCRRVRATIHVGGQDQWDEAVSSLEGSTFCHLAGWADVMQEALGHEVVQWIAMDDQDCIRGVLPLARVRSRFFGDYLLSMPFLSYGGPLGPPEAQEVLVEKAVEEAKRLGVDLLELRARRELPGGLHVSRRKLTVVKSLPGSVEELWEAGLRSKVRSQVRRPMKEGLETRFGADLVDDFYAVFAETMRDLGTPVLPRRFFTAIAERFPDQAVFAVVEREGVSVAAGCGFLWAGEFEITWAGALRQYSRSAPNMLLYWSLMEECVRRGAHTFNFGRCSPDSGTHRFKQQWGTEDQPLLWVQWSPTGVFETPNPDSPKFRLATSAWTRLPLGVANALGPLLSRSLP